MPNKKIWQKEPISHPQPYNFKASVQPIQPTHIS